MRDVDTPSALPVFRTFAAALAIVGVVACGPDTRTVDELVHDGNRYLVAETMEPYTGMAVATFRDRPDVVARRLSLSNGSYHGPFERFFENRTLSSLEYYTNGVKDGPYEWYFENGQLFEEGTYHNGQLDGPYRAYWDSGELYEEGSYRNGRYDGPRRWFMDGRLVELVTYRYGETEGLYERYRPDGTIELKGMLYEGEACGTWVERDRTIHYPVCGPRITE